MDVFGRQPWERQEGEPPQWFSRFNAYRLLGPGRTVQGAWEAEEHKKTQTPSRSWYVVSQEWNWKERAAAWDVYVANENAAEQARRRRDLALKAFDKLEKRLSVLDDGRITPRTYAEMMKIIFDELRTEYDQQPAAKVDISVTYRQAIEQIAKANGVDPDELETRTMARLRELGLGV